jgi:hypothetical protein
VPKTEKNPKPRIFPLQIRLDVPGTPLTGFRFDGPMFCALMGSDLSCTLYNKCIFNKTGKVVPESCDQMSHHFLIVYRSNFKTDPSGVNRCLQNCTDGKMQTPWAGPVLVLKCTGFIICLLLLKIFSIKINIV